MANRSNFGDILEPGLREIFFTNYQAKPQKYTKVFNVLKSTKQEETDSSVSGFGKFDEVGEGSPLPYEEPLQGYDVSYVHKSYKKGFKVTEELYEDEQYNVINRMPKRLGESARRTVEQFAADILNDGFTSSVRVGGDAKALFATDHPRVDGGTAISNIVGTNMDLAEDAIKLARQKMRETLDDKGELIDVMPNQLVVPGALDETARILIKSTGRTATTSLNEINPYQDEMEVVVWDYLSAAAGGSDTAWFMFDTAVREINFFWRKALTFAQDSSFSTDEALYKAKMRFSAGWSNWRGAIGSTGLNS